MSQTLGRYTLLGKIASGGMAEVFLARLDGTSGFARQVVIKRVLPHYASQPEFLKLFEQEARFASFLSHPHIATVSDFGVDPQGAAYLVMEHVEGASLRGLLLAAGRLNERPDARLISRVFSQVAQALAAVHAAIDPSTGHALDLVHRDVSPENVLLSRQGAVKLADFGIARAMNEVSTTSPDVVRGKLRYMAPEQVTGLQLSPAIDVWALGVCLYESLAGRRPFGEGHEGQTVHAIVNGEYPALSSLRSDLPKELIGLVDRCLSLEPSARPDVEDLALELERVSSGGGAGITGRVIGNWVDRLAPPRELTPLDPEPSRATPPSPPPAPSPPPETSLPFETPLPPPTTDEPPRRRRWPLLVTLVGVVVIGALGVGARARSQSPALRQVLVTSRPSGATVRYGQLVLGQTPWAGDLPAVLDVELELSAPGFESVKKTLRAGEAASLEVSLKKSR